MVKTADIARELIRDVGGDPSNAAMVRAVSIWVSYESGSQILSNNPWNLRPGSDYNTCNKGADSKNFTVFCSWQDGVKASAQRLSHDDYRGYRPIYNAIQRGDPLGFFSALAKSKWSSDHYGGGGKFVTAFKSGTNYNRTLSFGSRAGSPSAPKPSDKPDSRPPITPDLKAFGDIISYPVGHIITDKDVGDISDKLHDAGYFEPDYFDVKRIAFEAFLKANAVGKAWDKPLQDTLAGKASETAGQVGSATDPLGLVNVANSIAGLGNLATKLAAYAVAVVFIVVGLFIYAKAGQATGVPNVVPE